MLNIIIGCTAFVFFNLFDLNKIKFINKLINLSFAMGIFLIMFATCGLVFGDYVQRYVPLVAKIIFYLLSFVMMLLLFYALFGALPFTKTYVKHEAGTDRVIDTGIYALCRHPGVLFFFFVFLFLWLATGRIVILAACIVWTIMDVIHVFIQDRFFFPHTLQRYEKYQRNVPFLIPTPGSMKRFFTDVQTQCRGGRLL